MILGIGSDLVAVDRIRKALELHGDRFMARVFTAHEQQGTAAKADPASYLAKRFAAKEACAKALGSGLWRAGVTFTDIGIETLDTGKPVLRLTGGALLRAQSLCPAGERPLFHLTLSDDEGLAQAFVVIEACPVVNPQVAR